MTDLKKPKERTLFFSGEFSEDSAKNIVSKIVEINEADEFTKKYYKVFGLKYKAKPIKIYIDSYGGHLHQAFGIVDIIQSSKTKVHTICTGAAMSAGFLMLISGHKRFAYENSSIMYHQLSAGAYGKMQDIKERGKYTKKIQKQMEKFVIKNTNLTKEILKKNRKMKKDWFLTSKEAKELKIIDEIKKAD